MLRPGSPTVDLPALTRGRTPVRSRKRSRARARTACDPRRGRRTDGVGAAVHGRAAAVGAVLENPKALAGLGLEGPVAESGASDSGIALYAVTADGESAALRGLCTRMWAAGDPIPPEERSDSSRRTQVSPPPFGRPEAGPHWLSIERDGASPTVVALPVLNGRLAQWWPRSNQLEFACTRCILWLGRTRPPSRPAAARGAAPAPSCRAAWTVRLLALEGARDDRAERPFRRLSRRLRPAAARAAQGARRPRSAIVEVAPRLSRRLHPAWRGRGGSGRTGGDEPGVRRRRRRGVSRRSAKGSPGSSRDSGRRFQPSARRPCALYLPASCARLDVGGVHASQKARRREGS